MVCNLEIESYNGILLGCWELRSDCRNPNLRNCIRERARGCCAPMICAERHGFEYYRDGTLSLYAALDTKSGKVVGQSAAPHTTEEFVASIGQIVALESKGREIHIIADNLSAHKTKRVAQSLAEHPRLHLHFTPTYSSWLNQVELWFARIERDVAARRVFASLKDLAHKLMRYIRHHNQTAAPIKMGLPRLLSQNNHHF